MTPTGTGVGDVAGRSPERRPRWLPVAALAATVALLGLLPFWANREFYFADDSAAVFLPTWRAAGLDLLSGSWPALRPDVWMGGNWAVEAQFGLFSPVNLVLMMVVASLSDLAVAATVVKVAFQVLLACGTWLLAREYGAKPWAAWALAAALPFAGFTLYFDTSTWVAGLMAFAWTPWFWWASRRCARGRLNPLVMFALGYLLMTNGNPYGALAALLVLGAVALEVVIARDVGALVRVSVVGALVGMTAGAAYLPLVLSSDAGWRESVGLLNDGFLVPDLTMLAATSTPSAMPFIRVWSGSGTTVPLAYSAWFLVPLLPWLDWSSLRRQWRRLAGLLAVLVAYLALALGPSNLWLFRWPARLLEYVWLPAFVLVAVALSAGVVRSRWRARTAASLGLVFAGAWLAFSAQTEIPGRHLTSLAVHLALVAVLVAVLVWRQALAPLVMVTGAVLVLGLQLTWMPENADVARWRFPSTAADLRGYAERVDGPVLQVATPDLIPLEERAEAWDWLLFGSMPAAAEVESTTSYTGIGNDDFSQTLCMNHTGATCAQALDAAFAPAGDLVAVPHLVDALKTRTVVVQTALAPDAGGFAVPPSWERVASDPEVVVFRRTGEQPWPDSRLAAISTGVTVSESTSSAATDSVRLSTGPDGGALLLARLAWPGYHASVAGEELEVSENAQGLLEVALPPGLDDETVEVGFAVPGLSVTVPLLLFAVVGALAYGLLWARVRRARGPRDDVADTAPVDAVPVDTAPVDARLGAGSSHAQPSQSGPSRTARVDAERARRDSTP